MHVWRSEGVAELEADGGVAVFDGEGGAARSEVAGAQLADYVECDLALHHYAQGQARTMVKFLDAVDKWL